MLLGWSGIVLGEVMDVNGKVVTLLIVTVAVMAGANSDFSEAAGKGSVTQVIGAADLQESPVPYAGYIADEDLVASEVQTLEAGKVNPERATLNYVTSLFDTNSYFVTGDTAYCTDVLGTAKISYGLALSGTAQNPEGRTDLILGRKERDQGNLIIVGGPAVNPAAIEFGGYCGISYENKEHVSFTITCERKSIYLDLTRYPHEDICIIYVEKFDTRNVMLVWGYGWQGTYAGSTFMGDPLNWEEYEGAHLLFLRWKDYNRDGLVQMGEIIVELFV